MTSRTRRTLAAIAVLGTLLGAGAATAATANASVTHSAPHLYYRG